MIAGWWMRIRNYGQTVIQKLFTDIGPKFIDAMAEYTRIIKLNDWRIGDAGSLVILQLLTERIVTSGYSSP